LLGNNSTLQSTSAHETSFFSWTTVVRMYNVIPGEVTPCKNVYEAKMYTTALLGVLSMCFLPLVIAACWVYFSAKKGGQA